jgi:hypothetical protein
MASVALAAFTEIATLENPGTSCCGGGRHCGSWTPMANGAEDDEARGVSPSTPLPTQIRRAILLRHNCGTENCRVQHSVRNLQPINSVFIIILANHRMEKDYPLVYNSKPQTDMRLSRFDSTTNDVYSELYNKPSGWCKTTSWLQRRTVNGDR